MDRDWSIEYKVEYCSSEGFAVLLHGPRRDEAKPCEVMAQVVGVLGDTVPWHEANAQRIKMEVAREEAEALYSLLNQARVSPFPPTAMGLDGENHTLTLRGLLNSAQFRWFMELPECWIALQPVVSKMLSFAKECLGDKGCFHDAAK